ncbi:hypothetical protein [uncultured Pseudoteredinibacter sp.]|uniref:hypothetical protein n=1 Tax=uncultured Pseudoteredinibacter sp. TaxID=1641701 RepID=UPI002616D98B|nr:hypothetical protein [uncultured Pseudoteredinibacter sp.]
MNKVGSQILVILISSFMLSLSHSEGISVEASNIEAAFSSFDDKDSKSKSVQLGWVWEWKSQNRRIRLLDYNVIIESKPYVKYTDEKIISTRKKTTKFGFEAIKLSVPIGDKQAWKPFVSIGAEESDIRTISEKSISEDEDTLHTLSFGFSYGTEDQRIKIDLYSTSKYKKFIKDRIERESGVKFTYKIWLK